MGTPPNKIKATTPVPAPSASPQIKKINCFVIPVKPDKPGLVVVSTGKTLDGCFVLGWQAQSTNWVASDGPQWYSLAGHMLKADLAFSAVFAVCLLVAVVVTRVR